MKSELGVGFHVLASPDWGVNTHRWYFHILFIQSKIVDSNLVENSFLEIISFSDLLR